MQKTKYLITLGQKLGDKYLAEEAPDTLRSTQLDPELLKVKDSILEIKAMAKELEDAFADALANSSGPITKYLAYYGTIIALNAAKSKLKTALKSFKS